MKQRTKSRIYATLALLAIAGLGLFFILSSFNENLMYFQTPTEVLTQQNNKQQRRVGGMVVDGSLQRSSVDLSVQFDLTDYQSVLPVRYTGILPDLFREGQGVVVIGQLADGVLVAETVLAKHDEKYMPKEIADIIKNKPVDDK